MPARSKFVICWISFVIFLIAAQMISIFVLNIVQSFSGSDQVLKEKVQIIYLYQRYMVVPIFDLILSSTITSVFYYQAMVLKREMQKVELVDEVISSDDD